MAFAQSELSLMAYTGAGDNGFRDYVYTNSEDEVVTGTGFFNAAAGQMATGDRIYDIAKKAIYKVTVTAGAVTLDLINTDPA